jgi:putative metallohydrolase (TIGR04338 family)
MRDSQRAKVYDAENLVHRIFDRSAEFPVVEVAGSRLTLPVERHFATLESVQAYVDAVLASTAVRARWPRADLPVAVRERSGQQQADYQRLTAVLAVPLHAGNRAWALRELVILHELAHHLADADDEEAHGPAFTERLIALTGEIVGEEAGFLLRTTMWDNGVRIG